MIIQYGPRPLAATAAEHIPSSTRSFSQAPHRLHTARHSGALLDRRRLTRRRGRRPAPHLRDHLAPRRRQDHADREAAAVRRRDPAGRRRSRRARASARRARSDWMKIEQQRGISVTDLGDDLRVRRLHVQPARHAGPRGLLRGHLPHADRGRLGGHGDRRRQGHRAADPQAVRGLPPARHADHHLHQQARPRGARPVRAARRDRSDELALDVAPDDLADRHGPELQGRVRPAPADDSCCWARADGAGVARTWSPERGDSLDDARAATPSWPSCARSSRWSRARCPPFDRAELPRRPSDAGLLRQRLAATSACASCWTALADLRARRRGRSRPTSAPSSPARTRSPASCSRSRPTWTPSTATASPSCASARATSSAA